MMERPNLSWMTRDQIERQLRLHRAERKGIDMSPIVDIDRQWYEERKATLDVVIHAYESELEAREANPPEAPSRGEF